MFILNLFKKKKKKKNSLPYLKKNFLYNNVTINLDNMPAELLFLDEDDAMNIEEETNDLAIDSSEKTIETIILHRSSSVSCQLVSQSFF